jgi:hypothetical protein
MKRFIVVAAGVASLARAPTGPSAVYVLVKAVEDYAA